MGMLSTVFSAYQVKSYISVALQVSSDERLLVNGADLFIPSRPDAVFFEDTDPREGFIGGVVTVTGNAVSPAVLRVSLQLPQLKKRCEARSET